MSNDSCAKYCIQADATDHHMCSISSARDSSDGYIAWLHPDSRQQFILINCGGSNIQNTTDNSNNLTSRECAWKWFISRFEPNGNNESGDRRGVDIVWMTWRERETWTWSHMWYQVAYLTVGPAESSPSPHQKCPFAWLPDHQAPWHRPCNIHTLSSQTLQTHSHRYWMMDKYTNTNRKNRHIMLNNSARNVIKKTTNQPDDHFWIIKEQRASIVCILLPSWYSVWSSTAHTAGTVASAVSTHRAHHALVQLPLVHAWLAHHALLFLLL